MKKINKIIIKISGMTAAIALMIGITSSMAYCTFFFHQPKIPKSMEKYKKADFDSI